MSPLTDAPIAAPIVQAARPEYVRIPKTGTVCPWSGLGRSYMAALIAEGKIASITLRQQGRSRGVRLVRLSSLLDYIERVGAASAK